MRLRRVEAARYGSFVDAALGDFGDGLNIVCGPNEAGKSTYTSLVRHVLYGYPTQRAQEPGYFVEGAGRLGRLVFEDEAGEWVVERVEGPHGGSVRVRTISGADRQTLLADLTRGVSALAYRMVFGFGLDEMPAIEQLRGSQDDIIARLYAASAGLRVSPQEVRAALEREAGELFKPRGRTPEINALAAEARAIRSELRGLRSETDSFRLEQQRLEEMRELLVEQRKGRDAARARATELAIALERAEERLETIKMQDETLLDLRRQRGRLDSERKQIGVDEALLADSAELDALLEESVVQAQLRSAMGEAAAALALAEARVDDAVTRSGVPLAVLMGLAGSAETGVAVEEARDALQRLSLQSEARNEAMVRARETHERTLRDAQAALEAAGVIDTGERDGAEPLSDAVAGAVASRTAALEALGTLRDEASGGRARREAPPWVMLISGLLAVISGLVLREWVTAGIGAVLVLVGLWFVLRVRTAGAPARSVTAYLDELGLTSAPAGMEAARLRRSLEGAERAIAIARESRERLREAEQDAALAAGSLVARGLQWSEWLSVRGLDPESSPAAVSGLLALAREAWDAERDAATRRAELARAEEALGAYARRLGAAVSPHLVVKQPPAPEDIPVVVNRVREQLGSARSAAARRAELDQEILGLDRRIADEAERAARAGRELREVLERFGLHEGGSHADLRVLCERATRDQQEADSVFEASAREVSQLEQRLESEARERRGAELHLAEAGARERIAEAVERYLTISGASLLLARAQQRYERERQPEVVRQAGRLFSMMTGGRYPGLSIPLGEGDIEVFDVHSSAKTSKLLSRGTAEQLYLSLRLGLIAQLGETGNGLPVLMDDVLVNFDPGRKRGAAEAIAGLAAMHQVVFFTCHPETASLFAEVVPDCTRISLGVQGCAW